MTSAALEACQRQLERELRKRGLQDRRIVDDARERLFDAVDDGLQRALSVEAAESEALVRYGSVHQRWLPRVSRRRGIACRIGCSSF
jgi:hypothetical protein